MKYTLTDTVVFRVESFARKSRRRVQKRREKKMEAIRKQATKLREQVAKQQQVLAFNFPHSLSLSLYIYGLRNPSRLILSNRRGKKASVVNLHPINFMMP